jgi:hypothetical protein
VTAWGAWHCAAAPFLNILYKNAVSKIETPVAPSQHAYSPNKMVAPPTFYEGTLFICLLSGLLLLYVMSMSTRSLYSGLFRLFYNTTLFCVPYFFFICPTHYISIWYILFPVFLFSSFYSSLLFFVRKLALKKFIDGGFKVAYSL